MKKTWITLIAIALIVLAIPISFYFKYKSFFSGFFDQSDKVVNLLVLGKGGLGHEAPDLTDTLILVSIKDGSLKLVSLPRDIWIPEIRAKLNSAYYWGKQKNVGFEIVDESVGSITGVTVANNVVIDFSVFTKIIDSIGGIEVNVENAFVDEKYPIAGKENDLCGGDKTYKCRYEVIEFKKGVIFMDGDTALKFVRSRNAKGDEGTDIAREKRQQLVISALKEKVLSSDVLLNFKRLRSLFRITLDSLETDIDQESFGYVARKMFDSKNNINFLTIPEEFLVNPTISKKYDNQYVFVPKAGNWTEVKEWFQRLISS